MRKPDFTYAKTVTAKLISAFGFATRILQFLYFLIQTFQSLLLLAVEVSSIFYMSHCMGNPTICISENKGADQLRSNCEADQRLCFRYTDSTIPLLSKSKISSLYPSSVTVQADLCQTWSEPKLLVFSCTGSYVTTRYIVSFDLV